MKIANIDREFISEWLEEIQWNFQDFKSHKKNFTISLEDTFFEKPQGRGSIWPPPSCLELNLTLIER